MVAMGVSRVWIWSLIVWLPKLMSLHCGREKKKEGEGGGMGEVGYWFDKGKQMYWLNTYSSIHTLGIIIINLVDLMALSEILLLHKLIIGYLLKVELYRVVVHKANPVLRTELEILWFSLLTEHHSKYWSWVLRLWASWHSSWDETRSSSFVKASVKLDH